MKKKMSKKKKVLIAVIVAVILIAAAVAVAVMLGRGGGGVNAPGYIDDGIGVDEMTEYFSGVVEPQDTIKINKDASRALGEVYVKVGDSVKKGDKLFSYDARDAELRLQQAQLELDGYKNNIASYSSQINELIKQRADAEKDMQLEYTIRINELQTMQKQEELNLEKKKTEVANLKKNTTDAVVTAASDGVIKEINDSGNMYDDGMGMGMGDSSFMTILTTGDYRVKGTVDELRVGYLTVGMNVVVRSRIDSSKTWTGKITKIDTENTVKENSGMGYYYDGGSSDDMRPSKYYFYVTLDSTENLILGQHVYVEPEIDYSGFDIDDGNTEIDFGDVEGDLIADDEGDIGVPISAKAANGGN